MPGYARYVELKMIHQDSPSPKPSRPIRVMVIIVSYKTAELVKAALLSLLNERGLLQSKEIELVCCVVDNASGDTKQLRPFLTEPEWQEWVHLIEAEKNGGFAYGNNVGFRYAFEASKEPDYFLLLNPDAEVRPNAVHVLVDFLEKHPQAGTAGSSLEMENGELWPYAFRFPNIVDEAIQPLAFGALERLVERYIVLRRMGDSPSEVDWYPGAAMMIRAQVIRELGGMDESYFLYYEETDFCMKVQRRGWSHWYVPTSRVMHIAGQSTGVTGEAGKNKRLPDYWFDSRRRYFQKNFGLRYAMAADALALLGQTVGGLRRLMKGEEQPPLGEQLSDFYRGSSLRRSNQRVELSQEYQP
jgi:N-acetylglucosaminyl-diphospho-decaprenol L-rhamnosyltransferase